MSAISNLRQQIIKYQRRLAVLKEQQSSFGPLYTPPHIVLDIEDTEAALAEAQETLAKLERQGEELDEAGPAPTKQQRAQIYLQGEFSSVTPELKKAAIAAFAAVIGISPQAVELFSATPGSIVFDLGLPPRGIKRLRARLQANSAQLRLLKVQRVRLELPGGAVEEWIFREGKFHLIEPPPPPLPPASPKAPPSTPVTFLSGLLLISGVLITTVLVIAVAVWWIWPAPAWPVPGSVPTKTLPPPTHRRPASEETPAPVAKVDIWLADGCNQEYEAGSFKQIFVQSSVESGVAVRLDGQEIFGADVSPAEIFSRDWQVVEQPGDHRLTAVLDSGASGECWFSVGEATPPPKVDIWLADGCDREYEAGSSTQIFVQANMDSGVAIRLDGEELFGRGVSGDETIAQDWEIPVEGRKYTLSAVLDSGASGECRFFVYMVGPPQVEVGWEEGMDRPGMDYTSFDIFIPDPDDSSAVRPDPEQCRAACLQDPGCKAYTYVKPGVQKPDAAVCYLKFDVPEPVANDCCVSGVKTSQ